MSLSPAAHGLYADLCLLTRLPLPTFDGIDGADAAAASLDAVKERVFGSVEGPPRTERESVERYILAIVRAFSASGARTIDDFDEEVKRLIESGTGWRAAWNTADSERANLAVERDTFISQRDDALDDLRKVREEYDAVRHERDDLREACETMRQERDKAIRWHDKNVAAHNTMQRERDEALATLAKAHERIERLQEINERLETRNREAVQAGASFGVETCGLLAEKEAEIARLRIECDRAIAGRDKAVTELEDMRERERIARADAVHCHQEMRALRADLATTRKHHADLTAAHAKLAGEATWKDKRISVLDAALDHAREEAKAAHDALTAEQGRTERLRAVVADLIADLNAAKEGDE